MFLNNLADGVEVSTLKTLQNHEPKQAWDRAGKNEQPSQHKFSIYLNKITQAEKQKHFALSGELTQFLFSFFLKW